jgi:quinol monooxygenase YgiN
MGQHRGILTPEERARVMQLQDLLIERFVEQREAVAERQEERVKTVEAQIDSLLREKEEIEKWAAVGSA